MSYLDVNSGQVVAQAPESERTAFIQRTYLHLAGAILAFMGLETLLIQAGMGEVMMQMLSTSKWSWLLVLALFMVVSYVADRWAHSEISRGMQYLGLGIFIIAEAIVFLPLIFMALQYSAAPDASNVLLQAALVTFALVAGITYTAFSTKKNFSFLAPALSIGGMIAMGVILASMVFGFSLGLVFFAVMILFAAGAILYSTSNIIHEYHTSQHVAASLSLFSGVALLFWYILQFLMAFGE